MNIIKYPNNILRNKSVKIEKDDVDVIKTLKEMSEFIKDEKNNAAGLALPQVGINKRGFVMNHNSKQLIVINPVFLKKGPIYIPNFTESCLSIDNKEAFIKRHKSVMMKFLDINMKPQVITLKGFSAVVAQHEVDHLDGILFIDKI